MRKITAGLFGIGALSLLAGCAMQPLGPSVSVFPAPYKPFEVFMQDQGECENYASRQIAGGVDAANNRAVGTAAITTALGLALGAATGDGRSSSIGAAGGAAVGSVIASDQTQRANFSLQRQYDNAYAQCMYAKGNQIPGFQGAVAPPPPPPPGGANRLPPPPPRGG